VSDLNLVAIAIAAVAAFVFAAVYYIALTSQRARYSEAAADRSRPPAWLMGLELAKSYVVAAATAILVAAIGITDVAGAVTLAVGLWIAFPVILLIGSVTQEGTPAPLAVIHAGDWIAKLLIMAIVVTVWQ
jgi:Protein of unknown function (DUF1761)